MTTTALSSSAASSSVGQAVTFTATVTPGTPTGIVSFYDGGTILGTIRLTGNTAQFTTSGLAYGGHTITAMYSGDPFYNGSTSAAVIQTISWFTPIVDRVNMLPWAGTTGYAGTSANGAWLDKFITGPDYTFYNSGYFNGWVLSNATITTNMSAPDGTSTAQKLVSNTSNSTHYVYVSCSRQATGTALTVRFALFAKAVEYRRICLSMQVYGGGSGAVSFDLISLAVSPVSTSGTTVVAHNATIIGVGSGWCLCYIDVDLAGLANTSLYPSIMLDNGTNTAAVSTTFTGDGSSGVLLWRSNMLPTSAWNMPGKQVFFDDFNSISTIDVNDTRASGYNWYPHLAWPNQTPDLGWRSLPTTPVSSISVSGSYLSLTNDGASILLASAVTNGAVGPGAYTGTVFALPMLTEVKGHVDPTQVQVGSGWPGFWYWAVEGNTGQGVTRTTEVDVAEYRPGTITHVYGNLISWTNLSTRVVVGNAYPYQDGSGVPRPQLNGDHRFNVLHITQAANGGIGIWMCFMDGMFVFPPGSDVMYSSTTDSAPSVGEIGAFSQGDSQHYQLNLAGTPVGAASAMFYDYVAIYQ
jgi:hypothetical protein